MENQYSLVDRLENEEYSLFQVNKDVTEITQDKINGSNVINYLYRNEGLIYMAILIGFLILFFYLQPIATKNFNEVIALIYNSKA